MIKVMTDCVDYVGRKRRKKLVICSYWECGGEPLLIGEETCHEHCLRYRKK